MIIFDTETTGLPKPKQAIKLQPSIVEIACIKIDDKTLEEVDRFETLVKPMNIHGKVVPIPKIVSEKSHGLLDKDVANSPTFNDIYEKLASFFLGEKFLVAHKLDFDLALLGYDLHRIGKLRAFPYPYRHICSLNSSKSVFGYPMNLTKLHIHLFQKGFDDAHRAMSDVEALTRCVRELIKLGHINL